MRGGSPLSQWRVWRHIVVAALVLLFAAQTGWAQLGWGKKPDTRPAVPVQAVTRPAMQMQAIQPAFARTITPNEAEVSEGFVVRKGDPAVAAALGVIDESVRNGEWEKTFSNVAR